jgi:hypothetical protein
MTQQVDSQRTADINVSGTDAPARWHVAAFAANTGFKDNAAHQVGELKIMAAFYHQSAL